jgi:predicted NBD/HSP70 family sugar kinase
MEKKNCISDKKGSKIDVLQTLRMYGSLSRVELASVANLSRAAISSSVSELIDCGLVEETSDKQSTGGRPATTLQISSNSRLVLGADFDSRTWTLGSFDLAGNIHRVEKIPVNESSPNAVINILISNLDSFISKHSSQPMEILGLGMPGLVDSAGGLIHSAADMGWHNVDIGKIIRDKIGWPTVVINRHRARGIAECRFGAAKDYRQVAYVGIGTGIAAGFFQNRMLITGLLGGAGELGHVTILPDGPVCPCGNRGCLQALASGPAMEQEARMLLRQGGESVMNQGGGYDIQLIKAEDICAAADQGDALAMQVVRNAAAYLGIALANLVNLFNPEAIILGGPIPRNCKYYVQTATELMMQRAMSPLASNVIVKTAYFKEIGGAIGAANYTLDKHLSLNLLMGS